MALRSDGQRTKKRILQTCVRLFLENGYSQTTLQQICKEAQVSTGSFFNLFGSKDGVLKELLSVMFRNQFALAQSTAGGALRAYRVPEELIGRVLTFVAGLDIRDISRQVMEKLLTQLAMQYDLSAADLLPGA